MSNEEDVLYGLDDVDALIILAIGNNGAKSTRVQKIALLLSRILKVDLDTEAYHFGGYSETVQERLVASGKPEYYYKKGNKYVLGSKGQKAYEILLEKLKAKHPEIPKILEILSKVPDIDLVAFTYYLFPETTVNSAIKDEVEKRIKEMEENGKKYLKVTRKGNEITIELPE